MLTNIFIDTSTYLSFYAVSNDDLMQLEKLVGLISDGRVKIVVTAQVQREWERNRDNKLSEAISNIEKLNFKSPSIPRFMWEYAEVAELRKALSAAETARLEAVTRAKEEAISATTNADKFIQRIFSTAGISPDNQKVFDAAQRRMAIGNPPGKSNSLGDRINWEHLLASELTDGDLHIISRDGDYFSPLDSRSPKYFLYKEWVEKKNGKLSVHSEIKPFLSSKFPQFQFRDNHHSEKPIEEISRQAKGRGRQDTDQWIIFKEASFRNLENSDNPEALEIAIKDLEKLLPYLGEADLLRICKFAIKTDLIHGYDGQEDFVGFFRKITLKVYHLLDKKSIEALEATLDIELHPEEFLTEEDPLTPNYGQIDLDLLENEVDAALSSESENLEEDELIFNIDFDKHPLF